MRRRLFPVTGGLAIWLMSTAPSGAASVVASNDSDPHPITFENGDLVPDGGGFVAVGTFRLDDAQITASTASRTNFALLVADFVAFGSSTRFGLAGEGGLFSNSFTEPIAPGAALDGRPIFLVGGNGADLADSDELWVFRTGESFGSDGGATFSARIELDAEFAAGTTLVGSPLAGVFLPSVQHRFDGTAMSAVVPEPGAGVLAVLGLVASRLRRRR